MKRKTVGEVIRAWRQDRGWGLKRAAQASSLGEAAYVWLQRVEKGTIKSPGMDRVEAICQGLGRSLEDLYAELAADPRAVKVAAKVVKAPPAAAVPAPVAAGETERLLAELEALCGHLRAKQPPAEKVREVLFLLKGAVALMGLLFVLLAPPAARAEGPAAAENRAREGVPARPASPPKQGPQALTKVDIIYPSRRRRARRRARRGGPLWWPRLLQLLADARGACAVPGGRCGRKACACGGWRAS